MKRKNILKPKQAENFRDELIDNGFTESVRRYNVADYNKKVNTIEVNGKMFDFYVEFHVSRYLDNDYTVYRPTIKVKEDGHQICSFGLQMNLSEINSKVDLLAKWFSSLFVKLLTEKPTIYSCPEMDSVKKSLKSCYFKSEKPYEDEDFYRFTYSRRVDGNDTVHFSYMFNKFLRHYYYQGFEVYLNELDETGESDYRIEFSKNYDWPVQELDELLDSFYKFIKEV